MGRKLINYLPEVLRNYREFQKIFEAEEPEFENSQNELSKVLKDFFVEDASERGVRRWEKVLKITPKATDSLEDRKFKILSKLVKRLPYTHRRLEQLLEALCGEDGYLLEIVEDFVNGIRLYNYTVKVRVALTRKNMFDDVKILLQEVIPANHIIDLSLLYNQHFTVGQYKHGELSTWTHNYIRNGVLNQ